MNKFIGIFLMVFCSSSVCAATDSSSRLNGTIAFSVFKTRSLYDVNYSVYGSTGSANMSIAGAGISLTPGVRLWFEKKEDNQANGYVFFEFPVSMFSGSEKTYADLSPGSKSISGSVVEMGIGARFGVSIRAYKKVSFLAGLHFEKVFLSFAFTEGRTHYSNN